MHAPSHTAQKSVSSNIFTSPLDVREDLYLKNAETQLLSTCRPLTLDQRTVDLFSLRQFRLTASTSTHCLQRDRTVLSSLQIRSNARHVEETDEVAMNNLASSWFSQKRSTEGMMRGTINEPVILDALRQYEWVHSTYNCGMVCLKDHSWMACSPDSIALLNYPTDPPAQFQWVPYVSFCIGQQMPLACVELKTAVSRRSLDSHLQDVSSGMKMMHQHWRHTYRRSTSCT